MEDMVAASYWVQAGAVSECRPLHERFNGPEFFRSLNMTVYDMASATLMSSPTSQPLHSMQNGVEEGDVGFYVRFSTCRGASLLMGKLLPGCCKVNFQYSWWLRWHTLCFVCEGEVCLLFATQVAVSLTSLFYKKNHLFMHLARNNKVNYMLGFEEAKAFYQGEGGMFQQKRTTTDKSNDMLQSSLLQDKSLKSSCKKSFLLPGPPPKCRSNAEKNSFDQKGSNSEGRDMTGTEKKKGIEMDISQEEEDEEEEEDEGRESISSEQRKQQKLCSDYETWVTTPQKICSVLSECLNEKDEDTLSTAIHGAGKRISSLQKMYRWATSCYWFLVCMHIGLSVVIS